MNPKGRQFTAEERYRGGKTRSQQDSFAAHNAAIARRGFDAAAALYGFDYMVGKVAAWRRDHPSSAEAWVAQVLRDLALPEGEPCEGGNYYQREVVITLDGRRHLLDFVVTLFDRAVVIQPGAAVFHGGVLSDPDCAARDAALDAVLRHHGCTVLRLDADAIKREPARVRRTIIAALASAAPAHEEAA